VKVAASGIRIQLSITPRAHLTGNPNLSRGSRTFSQNFNTGAVQLPAVGTFGNAARNLIRGSGINNWDLALVKNIPIRGACGSSFAGKTTTLSITRNFHDQPSANFNPANSAHSQPPAIHVTCKWRCGCRSDHAPR